jgi:sec-independent protein translocase protein TatB
MFDIGATELLLVAMVALIVIGPKDLPLAMRTAGRWIGQLRKMTGHFRVGIDAMIREAEIEEQEKVWAEKNAKIMREHPPEDFEEPVPGEKPEGTAEKSEGSAETAAPERPAAGGAAAGDTPPASSPSNEGPPSKGDSPESKA